MRKNGGKPHQQLGAYPGYVNEVFASWICCEYSYAFYPLTGCICKGFLKLLRAKVYASSVQRYVDILFGFEL